MRNRNKSVIFAVWNIHYDKCVTFMATITLKYNPRNKFAQALIDLIYSSKDIKVVDDDYNERFVRKIRAREMEESVSVDLNAIFK